MLLFICMIILVLFFTMPIFCIYRLLKAILKDKFRIFKNEKFLFNKKSMETFLTTIALILYISGFLANISSVPTGEPLTIMATSQTSYTPLSFDHILTVIVFLTLGIISYIILKSYLDKLAPIPYVLCCSILIINIIFMIFFLIQIKFSYTLEYLNSALDALPQEFLGFSFVYFIFMYLVALIESMNLMRKREEILNKKFKNKFLNSIYIFFTKYNSKPIVWVIVLFPVLIIIQLILVLFGQQPDSFIKAFFETSSYTYSKVTPPDPIVIGGGHYLCTVSAKGHEKIVKPLRGGIRRNKRILVNRQLLVANAFENILEEYMPRLHKAIRYIYDKYGYPLSKHINTKFTADFVYFVMKPLEWIFLIVLYCVDRNPENRINIQYSELRKF